MSDALRYRLVDEPRPSALSKLALPPLLVFMVATFFQPWGYLLIVFNAIALNGPQRNSEIGYALAPFPLYYGALALLDQAVRSDALTVHQAHYLFVAAIGLGLASAAFAFVSQARSFELRNYLKQLRGIGGMDIQLRALRHAQALMRAGNFAAAIKPLGDVLTEDPENAFAHDCLARCLLMEHRLVGAAHEAHAAIALDPVTSGYRLTLAIALHLQQHTRRALKETEAAIALDPQSAAAHLQHARFLRIKGDRAAGARSLTQALELEPDNADILAEVGYSALEQNELGAVESAARAVLTINPDNTDGLILMGRVRLAEGDVDEALRLALCALSHAPTDVDALSLLAATKMKKSWAGGLWWRWNRFLIRLGQTRAIFVVVGIWVVYRWAVLGSRDAGLPDITEVLLTGLYLAFVIYTISADVIVGRMVQKEIKGVRLNRGF